VRVAEVEEAFVGGVNASDGFKDGVVLGIEWVHEALCANGYDFANREVRTGGVGGGCKKTRTLVSVAAQVAHDVFASEVVGVGRAVVEFAQDENGRGNVEMTNLDGEDEHASDGTILETMFSG
jgi:hypothetical protein